MEKTAIKSFDKKVQNVLLLEVTILPLRMVPIAAWVVKTNYLKVPANLIAVAVGQVLTKVLPVVLPS